MARPNELVIGVIVLLAAYSLARLVRPVLR